MRIMLTGHADVNAVVAAVKTGAVFKFILKPWNNDDLRVTVALALERYDLLAKNRELARENARKTKEVEQWAKLAGASSAKSCSQLAIALGKKGLLNPQQVQEIYRLQQSSKVPALQLVLDKGWVAEKAVYDLLCNEFLLQEIALAEIGVDAAIASLVPAQFCRRQLVLPLKLEGKRLTLALADPLDAALIEELRFVTGLEVVPVVARVEALRRKIDEVYGGGPVITELETVIDGGDPYESIEIVIDDDGDANLAELLQSTEEPPAIRLVNSIMLEAIRLGASDIHIQPRAKNTVVRLRIDGVLLDKIQIPTQLHQSLVSRLKVMSELDISERRRPQDGRITVKTPQRVVDVRISTLPTINGEKIVMRILDRNAAVLSLQSLGFAEADLPRIEYAAAKPQGIILATGPTGSGKTTTLYSLLQQNATSEKNYVTIEDPVEYYLDSAGQVLIREKIGLTFPAVLRAILRQDPDVILLGEIRDVESAEVAFHAALSGHQVLSTLHTNSAIATLARLFELRLKPHLVATALEAIVAQRLVRRICEHCRAPIRPEATLVARLGGRFAQQPFDAFRGVGCAACHYTGYKQRIGLYEVFTPDDEIRDMIGRGAPILEIRRVLGTGGFSTLRDDAFAKVHQGATTLDEVTRVLGPA
jgi:type II secretory ATPase GspE/PulE/Tfp pilus assembly ATPase PilB-like protein